MDTKTIRITAYPYASQTGAIEVPKSLPDDEIDDYIIDNWDDIEFNSPDLDYCGTDFDWSED